MHDIDQQLMVLYQELARKEKIRIHLNNLLAQIERKKEALIHIQKIVEKEENDLHRIEGQTLYATFQFILGNRKEQLEKEKQEYLSAVIRLRVKEQCFTTLVQEKELLERTYNGLHNVELSFQEVLDKKEKLLKSNQTYPLELSQINNRITSYTARVRELHTTIRQGEKARKQLHKIIISLGKIERWGYDKKERHIRKVNQQMDQTHKEVYLANSFLQKFEDELLDLSQHFDLAYQMEVDSLASFLDQFIDALITDWIIKHKIDNSLHFVANIMDKIARINAMLEYEIEKTEQFIEEEEQVKSKYIIDLIKKEN